MNKKSVTWDAWQHQFNFIRRLSWFISSNFGAVHSSNMCRSLKSQKIHWKRLYWVEGRSRSSVLVPHDSSSAVLVMISSKSVPICNRSHARRANSGKMSLLCIKTQISSLVNGKHFHYSYAALRVAIDIETLIGFLFFFSLLSER